MAARLANEVLSDLLLGQSGDFSRIERLCVVTATGDNRQAGLHGKLFEKLEIAAHVGMAAVDQAVGRLGRLDTVVLRHPPRLPEAGLSKPCG